MDVKEQHSYLITLELIIFLLSIKNANGLSEPSEEKVLLH